MRPYATWSVLRRARNRAKISENRTARKYARSRITLAVSFLNDLEHNGSTLRQATQSDVDRWLADGGISRHRLRDFVLWASSRGLCDRLEIAWTQRSEPQAFLDDDLRWDLLRRCAHDGGIALEQRVASALALLYGLTPTQIVQLTAEDVEHRGDNTFLGQSPLILPDSIASMVTEIVDKATTYRHAIVGAELPATAWLFPGAAPGHHARASWISEQLNRDLGLSLRRARNTALCALAADLPASVLADLLGIHITTANRWTKLVKWDWAGYLGERA